MNTTRFANKRRRKPGDLSSLRRTLWAGLLTLEDVLNDGDLDQQIKASSALATLSGVYLKMLESADLEARIVALEKQLAEGQPEIRRIA